MWLALLLVGCPEPEVETPADDDQDGFPATVDCNDGAPTVYPGAPELCDGIDQDCDGNIRDEPVIVLFEDRDGDGFGNAGRTVSACATSQGIVANGADCDDGDEDVSPDAVETCDGTDNNCSGDEGDAEDRDPWFKDGDGDGYGSTTRVYACEMPEGYAERSGDCADADAEVSPGAGELCNGVDDDCDDDVDEADAADATAWYPDGDGDGYGVSGEPGYGCAAPSGYGAGEADCDDADSSAFPGAPEVCDGADDDCDGVIDGIWLDTDFDTSNPLSLNGAALWDTTTGAGSIRLTEAVADETGTAWYEVIRGDRFVASFRFESAGGTGGQGVAFALLDGSDPTLLGTADAFGLGGLPGYAVGFDPTADLVVLIETSTGTTLSSAAVPALHDTGPHDVTVRFEAGAVEVELDGAAALSATIDSYTGWEPLLGFSASTTATASAAHAIDDLAIGCP